MANFHKYSIPHLLYASYDKNIDIIVEIGSERGEGSTKFFDTYSRDLGIPFYSIDIEDNASTHLSDLKHTNWVIDSGSNWSKEQLPLLNKKIKVLYLDNFDWNHNPTISTETGFDKLYKKHGVVWTNLNCVAEHLQQMINCLPYMAENSIVICDDTPYQEHSGIYIGKCSAVIPLLINHGYKIVHSGNNGVILVNGAPNEVLL
jgi:hypothetical protein